jgi:glyoxylate/hydroxypyruvate reductase A
MLDVFSREPLPADHPLWAHPRVAMTPHIAATTRADEAIALLLLRSTNLNVAKG